ncbi:putative SOB-five-Like (SOFL) family [Helianthus annuus]|nr:putative SOB-five-Like (SOFL) family [Helianthus annuus]KAJ0607844.1 putative SOB-five-Like (SOFL) family [Helianthus annuus]KAJ0767908.1 putative SOB-five-Like (SOFL) family [Helianthus annuus]
MEPLFHDSEESSSGCESGWTLYLEHSCKDAFVAPEHDEEHEEHDDDDMSMVSDASSGPPHFQEHQEQDEDEYNNDDEDNIDGGFCDPTMAFGCRKRRKILKQTSFYSHRHLQDPLASLDDTASSPFFSFCNKDLKVCTKGSLMDDDTSFDYSQGHSTTYFEVLFYLQNNTSFYNLIK